MRKTVFLIASAALMLGACHYSAAADTGPAIHRGYQVASFTGLEVAGPYEVNVHTGPAPSVQASGSEKALDQMTVEVKDGTLQIGSVRHGGFHWGWSHHGQVVLDVTVPALEAASIAGSGEINVDRVNGARFKGDVAGSGDLKLAAVDAGDVELSIAGSGGVHAAGKAKNVKYDIAGSGDIDASGLAAETAAISIAGSGGVKGHATGTANVSIMGSGDVEMTGGAKCSISKAGSGDVRCS